MGDVKELEAEIERLRAQCAGLAQSAMNNGQDLLLKEAEIERLRGIKVGVRSQIKTLLDRKVDIDNRNRESGTRMVSHDFWLVDAVELLLRIERERRS